MTAEETLLHLGIYTLAMFGALAIGMAYGYSLAQNRGPRGARRRRLFRVRHLYRDSPESCRADVGPG